METGPSQKPELTADMKNILKTMIDRKIGASCKHTISDPQTPGIKRELSKFSISVLLPNLYHQGISLSKIYIFISGNNMH